jgi:hypothetical protein
VSDADDSDYEIEVIPESAAKVKPKQEPMTTAANGQDGLEEVVIDEPRQPESQSSGFVRKQKNPEDEEAKRKQEEARLQQQREAAKLAEQRKRFEESRAKREQAQQSKVEDISHMSYSQAPQYQQSPQMGVFGSSDIDMLMGLNQDASHSKGHDQWGDSLCMPGGIVDEFDGMENAVVPKSTHKVEHFNDDDEELMQAILGELDDM